MILAVDVDYRDEKACIAGVCLDDWRDETASKIISSIISPIAPYISGAFYRRELPCILSLLKEHQIKPDIIVIDGYVFLDGHTQAGLGKHLFDSLDGKIPVIGVAKNAFKTITPDYELFRGQSQTPLYITAAGIATDKAKDHIASMAGQYRLPTLLKLADQSCRAW